MYFPLSTGTVMDFYLTPALGEEPETRKVGHVFANPTRSWKFVQGTKNKARFHPRQDANGQGRVLHDLIILFNFRMDSENPLSALPSLAVLPTCARICAW